jgi:hypothetical protein
MAARDMQVEDGGDGADGVRAMPGKVTEPLRTGAGVAPRPGRMGGGRRGADDGHRAGEGVGAGMHTVSRAGGVSSAQ